MAIVRFNFTRGEAQQPHTTHAWPEGAHCPLPAYYSDNSPEHRERVGAIVLWDEHAGHCLHDYESNGYDDSDFYMIVWNSEKKAPETILFATTRAWSYPSFASRADATDEVRAQYEDWKREQAELTRIAHRVAKCRSLCEQRRKDRETAALMGCSTLRIRALRRLYSAEQFVALERLLRTKKFRSSFRAKLYAQVRDWLNAASPEYPTPLSRLQMDYV